MTLSSMSPVKNLNVLQVPHSWPPFSDTHLIEISAPNVQGTFLWVSKHHIWWQGCICHPHLLSGTLNVLQVPSFLTPSSRHNCNWDINMKLSGFLSWCNTKHHSWCQKWPCHPCLPLGTLNVLVPPFLTPNSWQTSYWDINMKFSGYLPWGKKTSFMTSGTTLSSMSLVRNPHYPPSTSLVYPPLLKHL